MLRPSPPDCVHRRTVAWRAWASRHAAIIAVILMAAGLAGVGINQHVFWDDEASTALFARALLHSGSLDAWDAKLVYLPGRAQHAYARSR